MFTYRLGLPGWKMYAKLGGTIKVRVDVIMDEEAGVFVATSPDLRGLVCEAASFPELEKELTWCIEALLEEYLRSDCKPPVTDMRIQMA